MHDGSYAVISKQEPEKIKEKRSSYYKCFFCENCGHVELPESITGKIVVIYDTCPECGEEKCFSKRVGRFLYSEGREWSWKKLWFKKTFILSRFIPGLDEKDQNRKKKKK
jgi:hypothetical protein